MVFQRFAPHAALAVLCALGLAYCGGDGGSPTSPSPGGGGGGGGTPVTTNTITLTANGVDNNSIAVAVGTRVMFVNNDSRTHEMSSNPHPVHTDCPELNIGSLAAGSSRESQVLNTARTCGFHDHQNPGTTSLQGSITIR